MQIEYLAYFVDVVNTNSISASAKKFFISQQGLSRSIMLLEKEFQMQLLNRVGNTITVTQAGKDFAKIAAEIMVLYEKLKPGNPNNQDQKSAQGARKLQIFATPFVLNNFFPLFSDEINQHFAQHNISIAERNTLQILEDLQSSTPNSIYMANYADFALPDFKSYPDLALEPLLTPQLMILVAKSSPLATRKSFTKKELNEMQLVCYYDPTLLEIIEALLSTQTLSNISYNATNIELLKEKLLKSNAISLTDTFSQLYFLQPEYKAIPIKDSVSLHIGFLTNKTVAPTEKTQELLNFFKNSLPIVCSNYFKLYPDHFLT